MKRIATIVLSLGIIMPFYAQNTPRVNKLREIVVLGKRPMKDHFRT